MKMSMTIEVLVARALQQLKKMILDIRRIMVRDFADDIGISFGSCQAIFDNVQRQSSFAQKYHN